MGWLSQFNGTAGKREAAGAAKQAEGLLAAGEAKADASYGAARGHFTPWSAGGRDSYATWRGAEGLEGDAGAASALGKYNAGANPYFDQQEGRILANLQRFNNRYGGPGANSGANIRGIAETSGRLRYDDYNRWKNALYGDSGRGFQADSALSGIDQAQAGSAGQFAGARSQNQWRYAEAANAAKRGGIQNWLNLGATVASAATGVPVPRPGGGSRADPTTGAAPQSNNLWNRLWS